MKAWACERYGIDPSTVVRPFWPGADYTELAYEGKAVIDNPPFSILAKICQWYGERGIRYFLFAPHLTLMGLGRTGATLVVASCNITYGNGAKVRTSFVTNMDDRTAIMSAPDLYEAVKAAGEDPAKTALPKFDYPREVMTSTRLGRLSENGLAVEILKGEATFIRRIDAQAERGKEIFGGGFLVNEKRALEVEALTKEADARVRERMWCGTIGERLAFELSEREKRIVEELENGRS